MRFIVSGVFHVLTVWENALFVFTPVRDCMGIILLSDKKWKFEKDSPLNLFFFSKKPARCYAIHPIQLAIDDQWLHSFALQIVLLILYATECLQD